MNEIVEPLSFALLHFLWQGAAIALALALALRLTRGANATLRYAWGVAALGLMLLMPVGTVLYVIGSDAAVARTRIASPVERSAVVPVVAPVGPAAGPSPAGRTADRPLHGGPLPSGIVYLWLIGVLILTAINAGGWMQIRLLRRSGEPVDEPAWEAWIAELRVRLGLTRHVAVRASSRVDVPMLLGWIRPVILVPSSALLGMSPQSLEALPLHELAHVRRHDFLVNLVQAAVETLLFYHPAVWWVSRRVRCEREHCCDDVAMRACLRQQDYVQALADMEELRLSTPSMAVAADGGSLVERIRRLTGPNAQGNGRSTRWAMGAGILALALTFSAAQFVSFPSANAQPAPPAAPPVQLAPPAAPPVQLAPPPAPPVEPVPPVQLAPHSVPIVSLAPALSSAGDSSGDAITTTHSPQRSPSLESVRQ